MQRGREREREREREKEKERWEEKESKAVTRAGVAWLRLTTCARRVCGREPLFLPSDGWEAA